MAQKIDVTKKVEQIQPEQHEPAEIIAEQTRELMTDVETPGFNPAVIPSPTTLTPSSISTPQVDELQKEIENVLSENLKELYQQLPADKKKTFREHGEVVARSVSAMLRGGVMQIKKVLKLVRDWLLIIPGVNKFFLEQEAKIKTDKIQALYDRQHQ